MRKRAKALTVAAAMVTTFAILPTFGAAAAEPLDDGSYDVTVGESTWTVQVVNGAPVVEGLEGVEFIFDYDTETGRVLDEFDVAVDGTSYDVTVADDGTVQVTEATTSGEGTEDGTEGTTDDGTEEGSEDGTEEGSEDGETTAAEDEGSEEESDDEVEPLEEEEAEDDEADSAHGELVSTVAQCAPAGKVARDAGLPNHGFFVRAAAHGESVEFEVDGTTMTADLSTPEGAEEFCTLAADLVDTAAEGTDEAAEPTNEVDSAEAEPEADASDGEVRGKDGERGNGNGKGRANAPGQMKKNG